MNWIDRYLVIRRAVLLAALWMTVEVVHWGMHYASTTQIPGLEAAAVLTAVQAPVVAFGGYVFKWYVESKRV